MPLNVRLKLSNFDGLVTWGTELCSVTSLHVSDQLRLRAQELSGSGDQSFCLDSSLSRRTLIIPKGRSCCWLRNLVYLGRRTGDDYRF
jgi:hypothetical protein